MFEARTNVFVLSTFATRILHAKKWNVFRFWYAYHCGCFKPLSNLISHLKTSTHLQSNSIELRTRPDANIHMENDTQFLCHQITFIHRPYKIYNMKFNRKSLANSIMRSKNKIVSKVKDVYAHTKNNYSDSQFLFPWRTMTTWF